jgi:hypothetical protein
MVERIFVNRFDNNSYTLSKKEFEENITDIAVVYDYYKHNPLISIPGKNNFHDIRKIICKDLQTFCITP